VHVIPTGWLLHVTVPSDLVSPKPSVGHPPIPEPSAEYVHVT
jgi:hypothetical protein